MSFLILVLEMVGMQTHTEGWTSLPVHKQSALDMTLTDLIHACETDYSTSGARMWFQVPHQWLIIALETFLAET